MMADKTRKTTDPEISIVPANKAPWKDLEAIFADAGFKQVSKPSLRRAVMRIDFRD